MRRKGRITWRKHLRARTALWVLLFAFAIAASAQQSGNPAADSAPPLKIGSGDLIEVTMFENPDLSGRFRVDENGDITVPLIGRVHVEGLYSRRRGER